MLPLVLELEREFYCRRCVRAERAWPWSSHLLQIAEELQMPAQSSVAMFARRCSRWVWIFAVVALVVLPTQVQPRASDSEDASSAVPGVCSSWSSNRRLSAIRDDILSKLSPYLSFDSTSRQFAGGDNDTGNGSRSVDPALVSAYEALSQVLTTEDSVESAGCIRPDRGRGTPAFAKRISLFFPANASVFYPPSERHQENESKHHSKLVAKPKVMLWEDYINMYLGFTSFFITAKQ